MQRSRIPIALVLAVVLFLGLSALFRGLRRTPPPPAVEPLPELSALPAPDSRPSPPPVPRDPPPGSPARARGAVPAPSAPSSEIVARLTQFEGLPGRLDAAQSAALAQTVRGLIAEGPAAVGPIGEYLDRLKDVGLEGPDNLLGMPTLRTALINALHQIGGPEASGLLAKTLQSSADPFEIGLLAKYLEEQAPGQYRTEAAEAAREALRMAAQGELEGRDVAPLFQVLQKFPQPETAQELEPLAKRWGYYATMALAGLPDGAGVPSLLRKVETPEAGRSSDGQFAWQMVAQLAPNVPQAREALLQAAAAGQIPPEAWPKIGVGLGGDQYSYGDPRLSDGGATVPLAGFKTYHIRSGSQNFFSLPVQAGAPDFAERQALIDSLLATQQTPAAQEALRNARALLTPATAK